MCCLVPLVAFGEVRVNERGFERLYEAEIATKTMLSEMKIGTTVFSPYYTTTCYESGILKLVDQEVILEWPENEYQDLAFALTKINRTEIDIEIAINKGEADGVGILRKVISLFNAPQCSFFDETEASFAVKPRFTVTSVEGLTNIADIVERAEHLSKIYAK